MQKKTIIIVIIILSALFLQLTCRNDTYKDELHKAMNEKTGIELFNELLALDQQFPDTFEIKKILGAMLLGSGDYDKAYSYFTHAEKLIGGADDDGARAEVYLNLSILEFEKKHHGTSLEYAEKALQFDTGGIFGAQFITARNYFMLGKKAEAYEIYDTNWDDNERMSRFDLNVYFDRCREAKNYIRALDVLDTYQSRFEYVAGQGLQASQIYEQLGMIEESILSAAMELEYLLFNGVVEKAEIQERLADIGRKLEDRDFNPDGAGKEIVQGLKHYFNEDWRQATSVFKAKKSSQHYFSYVTLVSEFELNGASIEKLKEYVSFEKYFKTLPGYYYHFWRGMKKGAGEYTFSVAREVLEKCVLLSRETPYALETRREIARLIGLEPASGDKLLFAEELDRFLGGLQNGEEPTVLDPVLEMLSVPDNIYTMSGIVFLRDLSRGFPSVNGYLKKRKESAEGRLKERLVMILEG